MKPMIMVIGKIIDGNSGEFCVVETLTAVTELSSMFQFGSGIPSSIPIICAVVLIMVFSGVPC